MPEYVLTISCPDRTGIVAALGSFIAERTGLIIEAAHFVDPFSDRSFMRTTFAAIGCRMLRAWGASSQYWLNASAWNGRFIRLNVAAGF
jgi:formyltetrahydrofolate hydrolase